MTAWSHDCLLAPCHHCCLFFQHSDQPRLGWAAGPLGGWGSLAILLGSLSMERGGHCPLSPSPLSCCQPTWPPWAVHPGWGQGEKEHSVSGMSQSGGCGGSWCTYQTLPGYSIHPGGGEDGPISRKNTGEGWGHRLGLISVWCPGCRLILKGYGVAVPSPRQSCGGLGV